MTNGDFNPGNVLNITLHLSSWHTGPMGRMLEHNDMYNQPSVTPPTDSPVSWTACAPVS